MVSILARWYGDMVYGALIMALVMAGADRGVDIGADHGAGYGAAGGYFVLKSKKSKKIALTY